MSKTSLHPNHANVLTQAKVTIIEGCAPRGNKSLLATNMTEAEVILKAQEGDVRCFEMLYARHKRRVFSLCLRMTGNYAEAEDFTQEAFLQPYCKIKSFRGESALCFGVPLRVSLWSGSSESFHPDI